MSWSKLARVKDTARQTRRIATVRHYVGHVHVWLRGRKRAVTLLEATHDLTRDLEGVVREINENFLRPNIHARRMGEPTTKYREINIYYSPTRLLISYVATDRPTDRSIHRSILPIPSYFGNLTERNRVWLSRSSSEYKR